MKHCLILHCDANNFFASVEQVTNPSLNGKAIAVTGDAKKRNGIVLAKNEIAKKCGIKTGDTIWQAKQKCPKIVCVTPHMHTYEKYSQKLYDIYQNYTDKVEPFSIDECFLDITDTAKFFGTAEQTAYLIKEQVKRELGITISVGVSFCKIFAKLGSDMKKPDAVTCIPEYKFKKMIYPLPIGEIVGIGRKLEDRFHKLGATHLGDIANLPDDILSSKFGIIGIRLKQSLLGYDNDPVKSIDYKYIPKSVGNGTTTLIDIRKREEIMSVISFLSEQICTRLRKQNLVTNRVYISVRTSDLKWTDSSRTFGIKTNTAQDIFSEALKLLDSFWHYDQLVRAVRISCTNLSNQNEMFQLNLLNNTQKKDTLNTAIDRIRSKYGYRAVMPCISQRETIISGTALRME